MKVLLVLTGHDQIEQYYYNANFMKKCKFISSCDLLIHCNKSNINNKIIDYYNLFPQKNKNLYITTKNAGYRLGGIEAVADIIDMNICNNYDFIIHIHPDVFIISDLIIEKLLNDEINNDFAFYVNHSINDTEWFSFDMFIFRPKLLSNNIFKSKDFYNLDIIPEKYLYNIITENNIKYKVIKRFDNDNWFPRRIDLLGLWHEHDLYKIKKYMNINKRFIFIDPTANVNHTSIKERPIGASEYQFYNLIYHLSSSCNSLDLLGSTRGVDRNSLDLLGSTRGVDRNIICYNNTLSEIKLDNIIYKPINSILNDEISNDDIIIIQRFLPNPYKKIFEKIKNNKIYMWIHDLPEPYVFLHEYSDIFQTNVIDINTYVNKILKIYEIYKNINFIFVSIFSKNKYIDYFNNFHIHIDSSRMNVIYNILYEDEFSEIKNTDIEVKYDNIVYASAWHKGIYDIINLFEYILSKNNNFRLILMSPGYEYEKFKNYVDELKNKFGNHIVIHGPLNKYEYAKIIKESLCVLTSKFQETFGCVFAESYYLGTPVIADIHSGALNEIIDNDFIIDYNDKEKCYNKILFLKNNRHNINICLDDKFKLKYNSDLWKTLLGINNN